MIELTEAEWCQHEAIHAKERTDMRLKPQRRTLKGYCLHNNIITEEEASPKNWGETRAILRQKMTIHAPQ